MKSAKLFFKSELAPPGFWNASEDATLVDGIEFESAVPTRLFQTVDAYPASWGRLIWRIQVNSIVAYQAGLPLFRTFYPGVEWNLNHPDFRWFLTAWYAWEQPGKQREPRSATNLLVERDTVLFPIAPEEFSGNVYLRSRIDARDRRRVAEDVHAQSRPATAPSSAGVIVLDDLLDEPT